MKNRPDKAEYAIVWSIDTAEHLPCYDTSCIMFDSDPKYAKGNQKNTKYLNTQHTCILKI